MKYRCVIKSGFRDKQKIHRAAHFGTTEYVIDMNLICNGYEYMKWICFCTEMDIILL